MDSPGAARLRARPRWRDPRLAGGILIVAVSVAAGAWLTTASDQRVGVLAAGRDLAAGTTIQPGDLVDAHVNPDAADSYLRVPVDGVVGRTLTRAVGSGELVPSGAVGAASGPARLVTIPVEPLHGPARLQHGDRVDVYVSARDASAVADPSSVSRLVLAGALVAEADADTGLATGESAVVLQVAPNAAQAVVAASRSGVIDLVRVPVADQ